MNDLIDIYMWFPNWYYATAWAIIAVGVVAAGIITVILDRKMHLWSVSKTFLGGTGFGIVAAGFAGFALPFVALLVLVFIVASIVDWISFKL